MKTIWKVLDPINPGEALCLINESGVIQDHKSLKVTRLNTLNLMLDQLKRGVGTQAAKNLVCVPVGMDRPKNKDSKTLGQIVIKNHRGNAANLRDLPSEIRYTGKVNWKDSGVQEQISHLHAAGKSIRFIARELNVTPQALTHANKQHGLYPPRQSPISKKDPKA